MKGRCIGVSLMVCLMLTACAAPKPKQTFSAVDLYPRLQSGQYVQKADNVMIVSDLSLSMLDAYKGKSKLDLETNTLHRLNRTIAGLKLQAALRVFGDVKNFSMTNTGMIYGLTSYNADALDNALDDMGRSGGLSPMEMAIDGAAGDLTAAAGRIALIVASDGEDMGNPQVQAAERIKSRYGSRICIYTIQIGSSAGGRKVMEKIAQAGSCGFAVNADDIASAESMADYAQKVFLDKAPAPVAAPPAPVKKEEPLVEKKQEAKAQAEPRLITMQMHIEFDTGKSDIKSKYYDEIKKVADFMKENPAVTAMIEGHTDTVGTRNKNIRLSRERAASVKNYLIAKFRIKADRLKSAGYGPDKPIADNATLEGRQKNRRVQAVIDTTPKKDAGLQETMEKKAKKKTVKKAVKKKTAKKKAVKSKR